MAGLNAILDHLLERAERYGVRDQVVIVCDKLREETPLIEGLMSALGTETGRAYLADRVRTNVLAISFPRELEDGRNMFLKRLYSNIREAAVA